MPEPIPNLYRRQTRPALPPEAYYTYGGGPEYAFFNRVPVPLDQAPAFEEDPEFAFPETETAEPLEVPGVGQTLVAAGLPAAGGYAGQKVGRFMGQGQGFGEAVTSTGAEIGDDISGLFGGESAGNIASNSVATAPVSYAGPTGFALDGAAPGAGNVASGATQSLGGAAGESAASGFGDKLFSGGNLGGAVGVGLGSALGGLIMGKSPKKAALGGLGSAAGFAVGNAIVPGIGGFVGGALGGLAGRVICTELHRQGLLDLDLLRCELVHTMRHLSETTRRGYWFWAVPYVDLMRRSRWATRLMRPIAAARAKEIAHVMGRRDRPHWGGRIVRILAEPACWAIGAVIEAIEAREATCCRT